MITLMTMTGMMNDDQDDDHVMMNVVMMVMTVPRTMPIVVGKMSVLPADIPLMKIKIITTLRDTPSALQSSRTKPANHSTLASSTGGMLLCPCWLCAQTIQA